MVLGTETVIHTEFDLYTMNEQVSEVTQKKAIHIRIMRIACTHLIVRITYLPWQKRERKLVYVFYEEEKHTAN